MRRDDALTVIADVAQRRGAAIFIGNGNNARAMHDLTRRSRHIFYMVGSMSLAPSIAAGYSHCSGNPTIVVEGDGNALMGMSSLPAVCAAAKPSFAHVVLDNGQYETTGGQRTLSAKVDLPAAALAAGYTTATRVSDGEGLTASLEASLDDGHRSYAYVPTELDDQPQHPRVPYHPREIPSLFQG